MSFHEYRARQDAITQLNRSRVSELVCELARHDTPDAIAAFFALFKPLLYYWGASSADRMLRLYWEPYRRTALKAIASMSVNGAKEFIACVYWTAVTLEAQEYLDKRRQQAYRAWNRLAKTLMWTALLVMLTGVWWPSLSPFGVWSKVGLSLAGLVGLVVVGATLQVIISRWARRRLLKAVFRQVPIRGDDILDSTTLKAMRSLITPSNLSTPVETKPVWNSLASERAPSAPSFRESSNNHDGTQDERDVNITKKLAGADSDDSRRAPSLSSFSALSASTAELLSVAFDVPGPLFSEARAVIIVKWVGNSAKNLSAATRAIENGKDMQGAPISEQEVYAGVLRMCGQYGQQATMERLRQVCGDRIHDQFVEIISATRRLAQSQVACRASEQSSEASSRVMISTSCKSCSERIRFSFDQVFEGSITCTVCQRSLELPVLPFGKDKREDRNWRVLEGVTREQWLKQLPDFDVVYCRLGIPNDDTQDFDHFDIAMLQRGVIKANRKSLLLATLAMYYVGKEHDALKAVRCCFWSLAARQALFSQGDYELGRSVMLIRDLCARLGLKNELEWTVKCYDESELTDRERVEVEIAFEMSNKDRLAAEIDKRVREVAEMGVFPKLITSDKSAPAVKSSHVISSGKFEIGVDGQENRSWQILANMSREEATQQFPDFDVAYLRAAYPTGNSGDHASAKTGVLEEGLVRSVRKSWILGRLSAYHAWKADSVEAFEHAVKSILAARSIPPDSPGDLIGSLNLLTQIFKAAGHSDLAEKLNGLNPGFDESKEMQKKNADVVSELTQPRHKTLVSLAADKLRVTTIE